MRGALSEKTHTDQNESKRAKSPHIRRLISFPGKDNGAAGLVEKPAKSVPITC
jgi:hypothetical protein